ncbi:MAG: protein-L-isoaspartate(D-aspartate) O-methyltransferase [Desulfobacterales bacterium]|jgi:protein-L-isoaspartate(D-aspartate) O-methyltransferase
MKRPAFPFLGIALLTAAMVAGAVPAGADEDQDTEVFRRAREAMVARQIMARGITDPAVLSAMTQVRRHLFVPEPQRSSAYEDHPLPIGEGQTISQPYIVALMTELLKPKPTDRVLEIGTGSGYQAAVLSRIVREVYTIEIVEALFDQATRRLADLGFRNVRTRFGDGYQGWPGAAPFDGILITAAVDHPPPALLQQLKDGGRLILPQGDPRGFQTLVVVTRTGKTTHTRKVIDVRFVPMTGEALEK